MCILFLGILLFKKVIYTKRFSGLLTAALLIPSLRPGSSVRHRVSIGENKRASSLSFYFQTAQESFISFVVCVSFCYENLSVFQTRVGRVWPGHQFLWDRRWAQSWCEASLSNADWVYLRCCCCVFQQSNIMIHLSSKVSTLTLSVTLTGCGLLWCQAQVVQKCYTFV